jgi:predicted RNase H-like HicB family nuclease
MNKDIQYYVRLPYSIRVVTPENDDEAWFAEIEELPGCMTVADEWEEILPMIREAMEGWISAALEAGIAIPEPRAIPV